MFTFDPRAYGAGLAELLQVDEPNALGPGDPRRAAGEKLAALNVTTAFSGHTIANPSMADCCLAAVWLLHDFLDESHTISQRIDSRSGSYWHGIMHRREPDYSNAKYWFRRVGGHPVFATLHSAAQELVARTALEGASSFLGTQSDWDPFAFVDLCEAATRGTVNVQLCRDIAQLEWRILFDHCYRSAVGD